MLLYVYEMLVFINVAATLLNNNRSIYVAQSYKVSVPIKPT